MVFTGPTVYWYMEEGKPNIRLDTSDMGPIPGSLFFLFFQDFLKLDTYQQTNAWYTSIDQYNMVKIFYMITHNNIVHEDYFGTIVKSSEQDSSFSSNPLSINSLLDMYGSGTLLVN